MSEDWFRNYIQLAWRLDKLFHMHVGLPFVDYYYGPPEWKNQGQSEPEHEPSALVHAATTLLRV